MLPRYRSELTEDDRRILGSLANCWCTVCHTMARNQGLMVR